MSKGVQYMILSTLLISSMQAMVKVLPAIPLLQIILVRAFISLLFCVIFSKGDSSVFRGKNYPLLLFRGLIGLLSLVSFFYTLQHIPLATAVTIGYLSPLFLGVFSVLILKEKILPGQWLALFISFAGVFFIKDFDTRVTLFEITIAVLAAALAALAHFMVRMLRDENPSAVLFYFSLVVIPVIGPWVIFNWYSPTGQEWFVLLVIGVFSHFGQLYLTKALKREEISSVNGVYYLGICLAVLFGIFFFDELLNLASLTGMILVLTGVIFNLFLKKYSS